MNLLQRLRGNPGDSGPDTRSAPVIASVEDYLGALGLGGTTFGPGAGLHTTMGRESSERASPDFAAMASRMYGRSSVVFACMLARLSVFSAARFQYQRFNRGRPSELFGDASLDLLERPWQGGTTGDLLARMIVDADLAGNSYWTSRDGELVRLRPDWVDIVLEPRLLPPIEQGARPQTLGWRKLGYLYRDGGGEADPVALLPDEVSHFAPIPDPLATYRGMSWLTPLIREVAADDLMTRHKEKFFSNGAPQPLDAPVLTSRGWSTIGAAHVGTDVIGSDGKPHRVTGYFPQGERRIFRVTFSDGAAVECTADHTWSVQSNYDRRRGVLRDMTLREMVAGGLRYESGPAKWAVPFVDPVQFVDTGEMLPVDPYLLGLLLGDGSFRPNGHGSGGVTLASAAADADETEALVSSRLPENVRIARRDRGGWSEFNLARVYGTARTNTLTAAIKKLGLWGLSGADKFVPEVYLRASLSDRLEMLRGLLDSDGSVAKGQPTCVKLTTTSRHLAGDVAELACSLGGAATVSPVPAKSQWSVLVRRLPSEINPFRLSRKAGIYRAPGSKGVRHRYITGVEFVGVRPAACIRVDTPDALYVTSDYVLTHNTPNMVIKHNSGVTPEAARKFKTLLDDEYAGVENAYKQMHLGGGADVTVVGSSFEQIDFKVVQGHGETRIAAAAGVPPVIVGLSEGLAAATYSNYSTARRRFADGTMHPLWQNAAGSLQRVRPAPVGARLWYDTRDIPFLREDEKDAAEIAETQARTMRTLVDGGYTPDSVQAAVMSGDFGLLKHSGWYSVQLRPPGADEPAASAADDGKQPTSSTAPARRAIDPDASADADLVPAAQPDPTTNGHRTWPQEVTHG